MEKIECECKRWLDAGVKFIICLDCNEVENRTDSNYGTHKFDYEIDKNTGFMTIEEPNIIEFHVEESAPDYALGEHRLIKKDGKRTMFQKKHDSEVPFPYGWEDVTFRFTEPVLDRIEKEYEKVIQHRIIRKTLL